MIHEYGESPSNDVQLCIFIFEWLYLVDDLVIFGKFILYVNELLELQVNMILKQKKKDKIDI